jgi:phosphatidate phosphatase APP1
MGTIISPDVRSVNIQPTRRQDAYDAHTAQVGDTTAVNVLSDIPKTVMETEIGEETMETTGKDMSQ